MKNLLAVVALLLAALASTEASACQRLNPAYASLGEYTSVFVGRLTGTQLTGYENHLLGKPDAVVAKLGKITITNGSSPVQIRVVVTQSIRGNSTGAVVLNLAGCTYDPPKLKSEALFFVLPNHTAIVVSREESEAEYRAWLERLGVPQHDR